MRNSADTNSEPNTPSRKLGKLRGPRGKLANLISATALGLMAVLSACTFGKTEQYPDPQGIERCYDPDVQDQYPFYQQAEIALAIHLILDDSGSTPINMDSIRDDINELRRVYGSFLQKIYVTGLSYYQDSSMLPNQSETDGEYKDRIAEFVESNGVDGAIDVLYIPSHINVGETGTGGSHGYTSDGDFIMLFVDSEGKTYLDKTISHEMGHFFELPHPFQPGGDGFDSTISYGNVCPTQVVYTSVQGNTCFVSCEDGSYEAPANLMDYNECILEMPQNLTIDQLRFANCIAHTVKKRHLNTGAPDLGTF